MYCTGIDEAALGPLLGPFCAASVSFDTNGPVDLTPVADRDRSLYFTDSKRVFTQNTGLEKLEQNVLALLLATDGFRPQSVQELLDQICPLNLYSGAAPWYTALADIILPRKAKAEKITHAAEALVKILAERNINSISIRAILVPAVQFNRYLVADGNKADTVRRILSLLAEGILPGGDTGNETVFDCQGGRRYYEDWLDFVFPEKHFSAIQQQEMTYISGNSTILFRMKADATYLHVAMASMISKYLRELIMEQFNAFWAEGFPGVRATAGYPQDGKRFIRALIASGAQESAIVPHVRNK
ncbi:MAG: hypothetical protein JW874_00515 [Spirochaetales bacterium]|nr:hypothetical protein [Spirochaetales bacterium]